MKLKLFGVLIILAALVGCSSAGGAALPANVAPTKAVAILAKAPTATNFPRIGTPTPAPPTATPHPTATPTAAAAMFDDQTLSDLMAGTIGSAGIDAQVQIVDNRAAGGERISYITIVSNYNIADNELLLKLFVLEVGNALRTIRAFSEGTMNADLDAAFLTVNNKQGDLLGTVSAAMPDIVRFLDGRSSVDEALNSLTLTGVFETFKK